MGRIMIDYIGVTLVIALIFLALAYFFPSLGGSSGAVTTVVAAMTTGQLYGQRTGVEVSSGFAWKTAGLMTLISLIFGALVIAGFQLSGVPLLPEGQSLGFGTWLLIFVVGGLLGWVMSRFAFRWGVNTGVKAAAIKKAKDNA